MRLFKAHVERHPEIRLRIRTHPSYEIQGLVQNRMADIGFVFSRIQYPNVISRPVYRELPHLLCRKDGPFHEGMDCADLDPADEVFISWSHDYQQWHDRHWEPERHPAVAVNTGSMLQRFLDSPKRWAVAPMSVIKQLSRKGELTYYRLKTPPPPRICYELRNRHPTLGQQQAIDTLNEELEAFVATNPDICVFEGWMLEDERSREKRKRPARGEKSGKMGR